MCEGNGHWIASSTAGFLLTRQFRPLCSVAYEAPDCALRRAFLRAMDAVFAERDHCRRIALIYRTGRALR